MRRGTVWTILVLATIASALVAYYLLPGWWAALVNRWVEGSTPWVTGLILGFGLIFVGSTALRIALRIPPGDEKATAALTRMVLGATTAVALVAVALTVFIALGITRPLEQARELWQHDAPGLLAATLVGGLAAIIVMLALALAFKRSPQVREEHEVESGGAAAEDRGPAEQDDGDA